jgi:A/G-specific adenine glycosylase
VVRDAEGTVPRRRLETAWSEVDQRERCLASLVEDGLLVPVDDGYALP